MLEKIYVIGSNGGVGAAIVDELLARGLPVTGVTISGKERHGRNIVVLQADAMNADQLKTATSGASHIFGAFNASQYTLASWQNEFPKFMEAFLRVGEEGGAKLTFIDNLYMYADLHGVSKITEDSEINPPSQLGKLRQQVAETFLQAVRVNKIQGNIVRGSDLFGPYALNGIMGERFFSGLFTKSSVEALPLGNNLHSFTFTRDFAKAAVEVALSNANGEVFFAPSITAIGYDDFKDKLIQAAGIDAKQQRVPGFLFRHVIPLFIPEVGTMKGMSYEFANDFVVAGTNLAKVTELQATSSDEAIAQTVDWFKKQQSKK